MEPVFNNVQNKKYQTEDGEKYDSRACAVVAGVWIVKGKQVFVLTGQRGQNVDQAFKFNIPCGYIDWNENLKGAMYREVWEETSLDLSKYEDKSIYSEIDSPYSINTERNQNRQNITLTTLMIIKLDKNEELPILSLKNMEEGEALSAEWLEYNYNVSLNANVWAFDHDKKISAMYSTVLEKTKFPILKSIFNFFK